MSLIPADWLPAAKARRIICHWTGGGYRATPLDRKHYHILIERDGNLVRGLHSIADNDSTADGNYAAHTLGTNTGSIGVAVCCMAGAQERPFKPGTCPMTEHQWEVMAEVVAELCRRYDIAVTPRTVLGHGEVQQNLGKPQKGKWDPLVLPWDSAVTAAKIGERFREAVRTAMDEPEAPDLETSAALSATIMDVELPAALFNENAWLRISDLVKLLGWTVSGADPARVQLTTARGKKVDAEHCFADGGELDPGVDAETCKELVEKEGFIAAADVAHALEMKLTFFPEEGRLVFDSPAAKPETAGPLPTPDRVVVQRGDTLSRIAEKHLGDGKRWRELRIARLATDSDAAALKAGDVILLPAATAPTSTAPTIISVPITVTAGGEAEADGLTADVEILARTLWGEARGEKTRQGREAVAAVILNRIKRGNPRRFGGSIAGVCQKKWQFSCWNSNDPNRAKLLAVGVSDSVYKECLEIARAAVAGTLQDPTDGADHYHTKSVMPSWARGRRPCKEIGNHRFYNNIP